MEQIKLTLNQKCDGYFFKTPTTNYFFVTDFSKYQRKNPFIVKIIDECLKSDGCTWRGIYGGFKLKDMLQRSTIELKTCKQGDYYNIVGDGFCYGDFVNNRETKIYLV